jgi:hypothetical protein
MAKTAQFRSARAEWYNKVYLKSDLWKEIRRRVMDRDGRRCVRCRASADTVHHKSYSQEVLDGQNDSEMISLCNRCHRFIEFKSGQKVTLQEANERLLIPCYQVDPTVRRRGFRPILPLDAEGFRTKNCPYCGNGIRFKRNKDWGAHVRACNPNPAPRRPFWKKRT